MGNFTITEELKRAFKEKGLENSCRLPICGVQVVGL